MSRLARMDWLAALVAVSVVVWPALGQFGESVLGTRYVDGFGTQWWYWYFDEMVAGRQGLLHTDLLFYPSGKEIFAHTGGNLLDAALSWPIRRIFPAAAAYNLWIVALTASNVLAGSYLGRTTTGLPGWPSGLLLGLNPYVLREIEEGRPTQAWLALPALALAGVWSARRPAALVGTGLAVAATGWLYWYYGLILGGLAAVVGVVRVARAADKGWEFARLAAAGGVAALVVSPGVWLILRPLNAGNVPGLLDFAGSGPLAPLALRTLEGDEAGLHVFAPLLGVGGGLVDDGGLRFLPGDPSGSYVGLVAAMVAVGLLIRERNWALLLAAALVAGLSITVAVGPALVVGDEFIINRPWLWVVSRLSVLHRWWWPGRAIIGALLGLAMVAPVLARMRWVLPLLPMALLVELVKTPNLPLQTWRAPTPAPLLCLAGGPPGAVIDLPFFSDQRNLWFQTIHHRPMLGGMLMKKPSFGSAPAWKLRQENSFLAVLLDLGDAKLSRNLAYIPADRAAILASGFRYIVVDKSRMEGVAVGRSPGGSVWPRVRRLLGEVVGEPDTEDEVVAVYALDEPRLGCGQAR